MVAKLVTRLKAAYPEFTFVVGVKSFWSPEQQTITYTLDEDGDHMAACWSLLHETAHAVLQHQTFASDFQLLKMELAAWQTAEQIAHKYAITIDPEHINQCLESYRDWLHQRSKCPVCDIHALQKTQTTYQCFNCKATWKVTDSRLTRPYRSNAKISAF